MSPGPLRERMLCAGGGFIPGGGLGFTSTTAYFLYWGVVPYPMLIKNLWCKVHQAGGLTGVTDAEIGLFTTPTPPNGTGGQTLTKLIAQNLNDLGTAPSMVSQSGGTLNTNGYLLIPGTVLWMGIWINATGMGSLSALAQDIGYGNVLQLAGSGALTASSTFAGSVPALPGSAPGMYATLD